MNHAEKKGDSREESWRPPVLLGDISGLLSRRLLLGGDRFDGAAIHAGTAVGADFRVDYELAVAFTDRFDGALGRTSAAVDAFAADYVCHSDFS